MRGDESSTLYPVLAIPIEPRGLDHNDKPEPPPKPSFLKGKPEPPPKPSPLQRQSYSSPLYPSAQQQIWANSEEAEQCASTNLEPRQTIVPTMPPPVPPKPKRQNSKTTDEWMTRSPELQEHIPPIRSNSTLEKFYLSLLIVIFIACLIVLALLISVYVKMPP